MSSSVRTEDKPPRSAPSPMEPPPSEPKDATRGKYTVIRRMAEEDVRSIFDSFHNHTPLPNHLTLSVVQVKEYCQKLSPPAYEFEPGVYVLLRPDKKKKSKKNEQYGTPPRAPPHLEHLVMQTPIAEDCPWQLSGPQFPQPSEFQQRYCYPKGRPEYSKNIGGALWTITKHDKTEDQEYRILHVYYSAKRAANQGSLLPSKATKSATHTVQRTRRAPERVPNPPSAVTSSSSSPVSLSSSSHSHGSMPVPAPHSPYHGYHYPAHGYYPHSHRYPPPPPPPMIVGAPRARNVWLHQKDRLRPNQAPTLARSNSDGARHEAPHKRPPTLQHHRELSQIHTMPSEELDGIIRGSSHEKPQVHQQRTGTTKKLPQIHAMTSEELPHIDTMTSEELPHIHTMTSEADSVALAAENSGDVTRILHSPVVRNVLSRSAGSSCGLGSMEEMDEFEFNSASFRDIDFDWDNLPLKAKRSDIQDITEFSPNSLPAFQEKQLHPELTTQLQNLQSSVQQLILQTPNMDDRQGLLNMVTTWVSGLADDPFKSMMHRKPSQDTEASFMPEKPVSLIDSVEGHPSSGTGHVEV